MWQKANRQGPLAESSGRCSAVVEKHHCTEYLRTSSRVPNADPNLNTPLYWPDQSPAPFGSLAEASSGHCLRWWTNRPICPSGPAAAATNYLALALGWLRLRYSLNCRSDREPVRRSSVDHAVETWGFLAQGHFQPEIQPTGPVTAENETHSPVRQEPSLARFPSLRAVSFWAGLRLLAPFAEPQAIVNLASPLPRQQLQGRVTQRLRLREPEPPVNQQSLDHWGYSGLRRLGIRTTPRR